LKISGKQTYKNIHFLSAKNYNSKNNMATFKTAHYALQPEKSVGAVAGATATSQLG